MIHVQIDTTSPWRKAIAQRYWALTPDGDFQEEVAAIAADHGFTRGHVLAVARSASTVTSTVHCCVRCGTPKRFTCRKAFSEMRRQAVYVCEACTPPGEEADVSSDVGARPEEQPASERPRGPSRPTGDLFAPVGEGTQTEALRKIRRQIRHLRAECAQLQRTVDDLLSGTRTDDASPGGSSASLLQ